MVDQQATPAGEQGQTLLLLVTAGQRGRPASRERPTPGSRPTLANATNRRVNDELTAPATGTATPIAKSLSEPETDNLDRLDRTSTPSTSPSGAPATWTPTRRPMPAPFWELSRGVPSMSARQGAGPDESSSPRENPVRNTEPAQVTAREQPVI
jgi:hypothetical protein